MLFCSVGTLQMLSSSFGKKWKFSFSVTFSLIRFPAWKLSKYGVISGPYFPVFGLNTGKYGLEITPYLDSSRGDWDSDVVQIF